MIIHVFLHILTQSPICILKQCFLDILGFVFATELITVIIVFYSRTLGRKWRNKAHWFARSPKLWASISIQTRDEKHGKCPLIKIKYIYSKLKKTRGVTWSNFMRLTSIFDVHFSSNLMIALYVNRTLMTWV